MSALPRFLIFTTAMVVTQPCEISAAETPAAEEFCWKQLPKLPNSVGVAGPFAGVTAGKLIVAGGANFPDGPPWSGGAKVWHDAIYVLDQASGSWTAAGKLPRPLAYGIAVSDSSGVICAGGGDGERHYAEVFRLNWQSGKLVVSELPPLPVPLANACGAIVADSLYVTGGQSGPNDPSALRSLYRLDLTAENSEWKSLEPCPSPGRILAASASADGAFWVMGGAELTANGENQVTRTYLRDAYRYDPGKGWQRIADLPRPLVAAPSPAPANAWGIFLLGGDDGSHVGHTPPAEHPGFSKQLLCYELLTRDWRVVRRMPVARVTVPVVAWNELFVLPSGEVRPGVRSPEVWSFRLPPGKK